MRFRSHQSSASTSRLAVETLEHKRLLAADALATGLALDNSPVNDIVETSASLPSDTNLIGAPGDANRDGAFNQHDLVQVVRADKYLTGESADWSEGDWNGDNVFDQKDLIVALQSGNYLSNGFNVSALLMGQPESLDFNASSRVSEVLVSVKKGWVSSNAFELEIEITGLNGGFAHHGTQLVPLSETSIFNTEKDVAEVVVDWTTDEVPRHVNELYTICVQVLAEGNPLGARKCDDFGPF